MCDKNITKIRDEFCPYKVDVKCSFSDCCNGSVCELDNMEE